MIEKLAQDATVAKLQQTLTRSAMRGAVVVSNVANQQTPGYRAQRLEFDKAIGEAGVGSDRDRARLVDAPVVRMTLDGNTVDMDGEMARLSEVAGRFRAATQLVRKRFALLRYALTDGRG